MKLIEIRNEMEGVLKYLIYMAVVEIDEICYDIYCARGVSVGIRITFRKDKPK